MRGSTLAVKLLLLFLIVLDAVLSILALALPDTWFRLIHDAPYMTPKGCSAEPGRCGRPLPCSKPSPLSSGGSNRTGWSS
jgi:hypothetical protein